MKWKKQLRPRCGVLLFVLVSCPLLSSCTSFRIHAEMGYLHSTLGGERWIKTENVNPLHAVVLAAHIESSIENETIALDQGIGPMIASGKDGWALGVETTTRLRWKATRMVHPYLLSTNGVAYSEGFKGSDVRYTFSTGLGAGVQWNLSRRTAVLSDVRWFHYSNGRSFHGDRTRQFFGLRKATKNQGYQGLGVFVGFSYKF